MDPRIDKIVESIRNKVVGNPVCAVILGSGLGNFTSALQQSVVIPYSEIPHFPQTSVTGHAGALHAGTIGGRSVLIWAGRFHHYEGHTFDRIIMPVQVSRALGCGSIIVTNAAGGINERFRVGDLMLIDDIITLMVSVCPHKYPLYQRFANDEIINRVTRLAARFHIPVTRGCYLFTKGPAYETKSEIRAFRFLGADAVGMSTAAEIYEAIHQKMITLGISLISNKATGVSKTKLDHDEIKEVVALREIEFIDLISRIITEPDSPLY